MGYPQYPKHLVWASKLENRQDIILGLLFAGLGLAAAVLARHYSGATGIYPMVLGTIMGLLGVIIAARAFRSTKDKERELLPQPGNLSIAAAASILYLALVVPLGFYTASVILMLGLPFVLGFRRPKYLIMMTVCFVTIVFVVFTIVLEKPLPAEFWSTARLGAN